MRPTTVQTRQCQDCPATISAYGGRKRCAECQDKERLRQVAAVDKKRRLKKLAARDGAHDPDVNISEGPK